MCSCGPVSRLSDCHEGCADPQGDLEATLGGAGRAVVFPMQRLGGFPIDPFGFFGALVAPKVAVAAIHRNLGLPQARASANRNAFATGCAALIGRSVVLVLLVGGGA